MFLAMKDEAGSNLKDDENDFMLDNSYGYETLEELTAAVIMMARIQSADDNVASEPSDDAKAVSEVNASTMIHELVNRVQRKTIIHKSDDDQIDSNIIFINPYVENNGGTFEHDSTAHDEYLDIKMLAYNIAKKAFKEREDRYLEDICDLEEKLSSHDRIVYKMGSIQTIHMLGKEPNKVYDPFLKAWLGYKNPERLKKVIAAQPKMYDEPSVEQTYFSIPSTSNDCSETKEVTSGLSNPQMPKESKLLKMFEKMGLAINDLQTRIDVTLLEDRKRRWMSDSQNSLREFYKTHVISMSDSFSTTLKELQQELIDEVILSKFDITLKCIDNERLDSSHDTVRNITTAMTGLVEDLRIMRYRCRFVLLLA
ncbi:hypothetical protein Tco_0295972 [Tanacetum coccineum]